MWEERGQGRSIWQVAVCFEYFVNDFLIVKTNTAIASSCFKENRQEVQSSRKKRIGYRLSSRYLKNIINCRGTDYSVSLQKS